MNLNKESLKKFLLFLVVIVFFTFLKFDTYVNTRTNLPNEGIFFEIKPGSSFSSVINELSRLSILNESTLFNLYARLTKKAQMIQSGEYHLNPPLTPLHLLDKFVTGDVYLHSLSIIEGTTTKDLINQLLNHKSFNNEEFLKEQLNFKKISGQNNKNIEGIFFPETYLFPKNTPITVILENSHNLLLKILDEEWRLRDHGILIQNPYQALILASIIEKESAIADEREKISGVFHRRLSQEMKLQSDPTVIYGIGDNFDGDIKKEHLRADSPYNTYTRKGLPPSPISLPGRESIYAALHPSMGNEIYFVSSGSGDGRHIFSETKKQHDIAVSEYVRLQKENSLKKRELLK